MVPKTLNSGTTVKYEILPIQRFVIRRVTANDVARIEEDIAQVADILDARLMARSLTDYERRNPTEAGTQILNHGDVEIH